MVRKDKERSSDSEHSSQQHQEEHGILFLLGPPRSGTKLLKGILDQAPELSIAPESHLFPKLLKRYQGKDPEAEWDAIIRDIRGSSYFEKFRRQGIELDLNKCVEGAQDIAEVIERLLRAFALGRKPRAERIGDKTPSHTPSIELLKAHFPDAKFIGIVRDPRDRALSIHNAWGKDTLMAGENWKKPVRALLEAKKKFGKDLLLIRYEDLLEDPEEKVHELCDFAELLYYPEMLEPSSNETFGSGKGRKGILQENQRKYLNGMNKARIRRIEELVFDELKAFDYPIHFATGPKPLNPLHRFFLRLKDLLSNIRFHIKYRGLRKGLRFMIKLKRDKVR